jgi:uncharacterized membrane protein
MQRWETESWGMAEKVERPVLWALASGLAAGAGLMFLLDPARGRRRRKLVRDKVRHEAHAMSELVEKAQRDMEHRAQGLAAEVRARLHPEEVSDEVLEARVRSRLGRLVGHPGAIEVHAHRGHVILRGPVLRREFGDLIAGIREVRGVEAVEPHLEPHESAEGVAALQGGTAQRGRGPRFELRQENWTPAARLLVGAAGGTLTLWALLRRDLIGLALGGLGVGSATRAVCNRPIRRLFGIGTGRKALEFDKIMDIHAPLEEVFRLWSDFSSFPRFLTHVREVRVTDSRSHWVVEGPAGTQVSWDAELTRFEKNRLIAWRSLPGELVGNAGIIRFEPLPDGATRLHIHLSYNPPGGVLGHTIAALFGKDPQRALDDDLVRFKSLLEQGKATGRGRQIHIEDLTGAGFTGHKPEAPQASKDQAQPPAPKTFH